VSQRGYALLESKVGHTFKNVSLLETALVHKSHLNENPGNGRSHNERLEFLGDSVLSLCISHILMERFPNLREGELSMTRAEIVNEAGVADVAARIGLGDWLFLGRGEENTGGRRKPSLLANACEAVLAAVYLDGGYQAAFEVVGRLFAKRLSEIEHWGLTDFKTRLQERAQALRRETPRYAVVGEFGPDHDKYFEVSVSLHGEVYASQPGRSKKEAEQRAAAAALFRLETEPPPEPPAPPQADPES
jgi:ribonuclease III